jgi:hypothetical protein
MGVLASLSGDASRSTTRWAMCRATSTACQTRGLAVRSRNLDAAREATGIHPVSKGSAIGADAERLDLVIAQIPSADEAAAKKLRDQRVVIVALSLHRRVYGTFPKSDPSSNNVLSAQQS